VFDPKFLRASHGHLRRGAGQGLLRKAQARTHEALLEAMGRVLDAITAQDTRSFFEHSGYHATAQLL
jgi:hypothetical protein